MADHLAKLVPDVLDPVGADRPFARDNCVQKRNEVIKIVRLDGWGDANCHVGLDHIVHADRDSELGLTLNQPVESIEMPVFEDFTDQHAALDVPYPVGRGCVE